MKHQARTTAKKFSAASKKITLASIAKRQPARTVAQPKPRPVAQPAYVKARRQAAAVAGEAVRSAAFEALEGRECLSASMTVADGILTMAADLHTASRMVVHLSHQGQQVTASINGHDRQFDLKDLKGIKMTGSDKDDLLRVDHRITLPTTLTGGAGDDRIYGGGGNDTIDCGDGYDYANGRGGNDSITGGAGNDTLVGGAGSDSLIGGAGNNMLYGGSGNDSLVGGSGSDALWGGAGNDTLDGSAGADRLYGEAGRNRIVRGAKDKIQWRQNDVVVSAPNTSVGQPPTVGGANGGSAGSGNNKGGSTSGGTVKPPTSDPVVGTGTDNSGAGQNSGGGAQGSGGGTQTGGGTDNGGGTQTGGGTNNGGGTQNNGGGTQTGGGGTQTGGGTDTGGGTQNNGGGASSAVKADIQFIEATGMAGHSVHVNALGSTLSSGDPLNATYSWDFGDPGSRFNTLIGWTAGHIYENAGSYTVTLTVTDSSGKSNITTGTVTIAEDARRTIYVDRNGSDANTGATPNAAVATMARAQQLVGKNTTILLHNGQTFDVADTFAITTSNVKVTTYGNGSAARLRKVAGNGSAIINASGNDVLIEGVVFDSMWDIPTYGDKEIPARGIFVGGDNFAVRDCEFYNVDDAIATQAGKTGVIVQDNYFGMSIRSNCIWGEGFDHVYIGNTMTNSTQEHLIRCADTGVTRLLIENNSFSRPDNNKGSLELRTAQWFYVRGNRIDGGTLRMGLPNGVMPAADQVAWGVVENNETFKIFVNFRPGASHIAFRDNVMHYDDGLAINIETKYANVARLTQDLRIDHNTMVSTSKKAIFLQLDGPAKDISVTNNLMVAPNIQWVGAEAGAVIIAGTDLSSFKAISDNIWPVIPSSSNQAGDNYMYNTQFDKNGYVPNQTWAAYDKVDGEQYANADLSGDQYSLTLNGVTAGALPTVFDTTSYKVAVRQAA